MHLCHNFLKKIIQAISLLSHSHINATFHSVICIHCEISHLSLGVVDDITHQIQFAVKIYTVQALCVIL